ncbi:MAG: hypothetical protein FWH27_04420 [Planctomycetaceae bacterium]|nr:hypothetical protein [Planctomycetaceae bacterium]
MLTYLIQILIGSTAILLLAVLLTPLLRRTSAAARHTCLCSVMIALLMLPLAIPFLPVISPPASQPATPEPVQSPVPVTPAEPITTPQFDAIADMMTETVPLASPIPVFPMATGNDVQHSDRIERESPQPDGHDVTALSPLPTVVHRISLGAVMILLCGTAIRLAMLIASMVTMRNMARNSAAFEPTRGVVPAELCRKFRVRREVPALSGDQIHVPLTAGIVRPVVFLPASMRQEEADRLRLVFMHELAHITRHDVFWQLLTRMTLALYWWHPLAWLLAMHIRREREFACDDAVLSHREDPENYASVLLDLSQSFRQTSLQLPGCAVTMAQTHPIESRIRAILDPERVRKPLGRAAALLLVLTACTLTALAGMFSPIAREATRTKPDEKQETPDAAGSFDVNKTVMIRGKVILPNGMKLKDSKAYTKYGGNLFSIEISCDYPEWTPDGFKGYDSSLTLDDNGNYSKEIPIGSTVILKANSIEGYASEIITRTVTAEQSPGQYDLRFHRGIPVRGKITFADGRPADDKTLSLFAICDRLNGEVLHFSYSMLTTDDHGEFRYSLLPGQYRFDVSDLWRDEDVREVTLTEKDKELVVDFQLPRERTIKIACEDGTPLNVATMSRIGLLEDNSYLFVPVDLLCRETDKDTFDIFPSPRGDIVSISANGGKYGIVTWIDPELPDDVVTLTLPKAAQIKGRLLDKATGRPVVGARGNFRQYFDDGEKSHNIGINCVGVHTDNDGHFVTVSGNQMRHCLGLSVGGEYKESFLAIFKKGTLEVDRTVSLEIPSFLVTEPGEVIDVGDVLVEMEGVSETEIAPEGLRPHSQFGISVPPTPAGTVAVMPPSPAPPDPVELDEPQVIFNMIIAEISNSDNNMTQLLLENTNDEDEVKGFVFTASSESIHTLFDILQKEGKISILNRPQITTLNDQMAVVFVGSLEKNLMVEVIPRITGDRILAAITVKRDVDGNRDAKTFQCSTLAALQENVPLFVGGLTMKSDDGEAGREIMLCVTAKIVPPKVKEMPLRTVFFAGTVFMPDGTPARNATVHYVVASKSNSPYGEITPTARSSSTTDENGKCTSGPGLIFRGDTAGTVMMCYAEMFSENGEQQPFVTEPALFDDTGERLWKAEHDLTLIPAKPVTGVVRYPDGSPAKEFPVLFRRIFKTDAGHFMSDTRTTTTDADGRFSLYLPSGEYRYYASIGYPAFAPVPVLPDGKTPQPFSSDEWRVVNDSPAKTVTIDAAQPTELPDVILRNPAGE